MNDGDDTGARAIALAGERLWLLPSHAAWHPASRTLFVADVHLGKAASFRALGQPVPAGTTEDNLRRLDAVVRERDAAALVVLGDLLHAAAAQQQRVMAPLAEWRERHAERRCVLVRGNHDAHAGDPPSALGIDVVDEPWPVAGAEALRGCHHPRAIAGTGVLAGHWHPAITLRGPARDRQRLPCFHRIGDLLVLPSFGAFTGTSTHRPTAGSTSYPVGAGRVWEGVVKG
ncbi:MAG: ligase-associated DNA damage response endonuclease PdeM [Betaproteobacteria bacterium]